MVDGQKLAVGIILGVVKSEGPKEGVEKFLKALPGADDLISKANSDVDDTSSEGGILSSALAPLVGGEPIMEAFRKLESAGLDLDQAETAAHEILRFARAKARPEVMDKILDGIPGFKRLV